MTEVMADMATFIPLRQQPNEVLFNDPNLMSAAGRRTTRLPPGHVEGFADAFTHMFRAIYNDVASGGMSEASNSATFADGHAVMLVLDAIAESARRTLGRRCRLGNRIGAPASERR